MELLRVHYEDKDAVERLADVLGTIMKGDELIVGVGTDKCIGDAVGPLVGTFLSNAGYKHQVKGTLKENVNAVTIPAVVPVIKATTKGHHNVIAVDACLGKESQVGCIVLKEGAVRPGSGVGKSLPHIGDYSIMAVTDTIDNSDVFSIRNVRLSFVMELSEIVANAIQLVFERKAMQEVATTK